MLRCQCLHSLQSHHQSNISGFPSIALPRAFNRLHFYSAATALSQLAAFYSAAGRSSRILPRLHCRNALSHLRPSPRHSFTQKEPNATGNFKTNCTPSKVARSFSLPQLPQLCVNVVIYVASKHCNTLQFDIDTVHRPHSIGMGFNLKLP